MNSNDNVMITQKKRITSHKTKSHINIIRCPKPVLLFFSQWIPIYIVPAPVPDPSLSTCTGTDTADANADATKYSSSIFQNGMFKILIEVATRRIRMRERSL